MTTTPQTKRTPQQIADSLRATAQAYHDGAIDHAEMGKRNRADWLDAERNARTVAEVHRILREDSAPTLPPCNCAPGVSCDRAKALVG
jgi:hypothetical protein